MTQQELLNQLADAMQRDEELKPEMLLSEIEEWDSLAIVSLISLYDQLFALKVTGNALREAKSIQDLLNLAPQIQPNDQ